MKGLYFMGENTITVTDIPATLDAERESLLTKLRQLRATRPFVKVRWPQQESVTIEGGSPEAVAWNALQLLYKDKRACTLYVHIWEGGPLFSDLTINLPADTTKERCFETMSVWAIQLSWAWALCAEYAQTEDEKGLSS